jgi:LacI family transcriptional regulator
VLNRPHRVSASNVTRVQAAMSELGFVRNESARMLRAGHSRTLAYIMLDAANPFFTDVAQSMEASAEVEDLTVFLCNSGNRADREAGYLAHLRERRVAGILITPIDPDSPSLLETAASGTPVVILDRTRPGSDFCTVSVDELLGGRLAIEHLIDRGHERVAFVGGPESLGQVRERREGARAAWHEAGMNNDDLLVIPTESMSVGAGRSAGERIAGLPARKRPTAAFCANDLIALGLLQHATSTGVHVPDDLAIVGYDDIDFAAAAAVPLTSVGQPRHELGHTAAEMVVDEATNDAHEHRQVLFTPELVARKSTVG